MYRYKRLLVGLNINDQDSKLIRFASLVSLMAESEQVTFVHVFRAPADMSDVDPDYEATLQTAVAGLREDLERVVNLYFEGPPEAEVRCELIEGAPLTELLQMARTEDMDLILVGKDRYGGTLAEKLARKAPCSVLIIPPNARPSISKVLVPVDFSDHSTDAMDVAVAFSDAAGLTELHPLHVYSVPTGYFKAGMSYDEFAVVVCKHAVKHYQNFIKKIDLRSLAAIPDFVLGTDIPHAIVEAVHEQEADLLVLGSRGRTNSAAVLLGSVTEKMIRTTDVPIVAVKKKGANLSFLDALLQL